MRYSVAARARIAVGALIIVIAGVLTPAFAVVKYTDKSGKWSDAKAWSPEGVPAAGDVVFIKPEHTITLDVATKTLASLTVNGTLMSKNKTVSLTLQSTGTFTNNNRVEFSRYPANPVTVNVGNIVNAGLMTLGTGTVTVSGASGGLTNSGDILFSAATSLSLNGTGALRNNAGGNISLGNASLLVNSPAAAVLNYGSLTSAAGAMTFAGGVSTSGYFGSSSGTVTIAGSFSNTGSLGFDSLSTVVMSGAGNSFFSGSGFVLGRLDINKSSSSDTVYMNAPVTVIYGRSGSPALMLTQGVLCTEGPALNVNATTAAEVRGTANGSLVFTTAGTSTFSYLNQSAAYPFRIRVSAKATLNILRHELGGVGRFDVSGGDINYTLPGSVLALSTASGGGGFYATAGSISFREQLSGTSGTVFQVTGTAVVSFVGSIASTVTLHNAAGSVTSTWAFRDLRIEKTGGASVVFTSVAGQMAENVTALSGMTVNPGAAVTLGGLFAGGKGFTFGNVSNGGTLTQGADVFVSGNWTGAGSYVHGSKTITFDGTGNRTFACAGKEFHRLTVDKGTGSLLPDGNLQVRDSLTLKSGTLTLAANSLTLGTSAAKGNVYITGGTFSINGGTVSASNTAYPFSFYALGGTVAAQGATFSYMDNFGMGIGSGALIDPTDDFSNCTFIHGNALGPMLRIDNSQVLDNMTNVSFSGSAGYNIEKTGTSGHITVSFGGGNRWGPDYENDPNGLVDWNTLVRHDVGVSAILVPTDTVNENVQMYPRVTVRNHGGAEETGFNVRVTIDSGVGSPVFNQVEVVNNLAVGETRTITFTNFWLASPMRSYNAAAYTELSGDETPGNDTVRKSFAVVIEKPAAFNLVRPANTAPDQPIAETLYWRKSERAAGYYVFLDLVTPPQETVGKNLPDTFYMYSLTENRTYYWRVVAKNPGGETPSSVRSFSTMQAPSQPVLISPLPGVPNQLTSGQLSWQASERAYDGYDVYLDVANPPLARVSTGQSGVFFNYSGLLNDRQYFWKVVAKNAGGTNSSGVWNFYTVQAQPGAFSLSRPVDGATNVPLVGNLIWRKSARAASYDVYLGTNPSPTTRIAADVPDTIHPYTTHVQQNERYYWRVVAKNNNPSGTMSTTFDFTTVEVNTAPDVGVSAINAPTGMLDTNEIVTPMATVGNFGPATVSFWTYFTIEGPTDGVVYYESTLVSNLDPGRFVLKTFPVWAKPYIPGTYATTCSTFIAGDINPGNDVLKGSFTERLPVERDVGVTGILSPVGVIDTSVVVRPRASVKNYGTETAIFRTYFAISAGTDGPVYLESLDVLLSPGNSTTLTFATWPKPHPAGSYVSSCSTALAGDQYADNDAMEGSFRVSNEPVVYDVGASAVVSPPVFVRVGTTVVPAVRLTNYGENDVVCDLKLTIADAAGAPVYDTTEYNVFLAGSGTILYSFTKLWQANAAGRFDVTAYTILSNDNNRSNDTARSSSTVAASAGGWAGMRPMPSETGKAVKDGGWLAWDRTAGKLYAAKGNKTPEFFRYDPGTDSWLRRKDIDPTEEGKPRYPGKGTVGVADGHGYVYMVKGNNTLGFWRYNVAEDTWTRATDVPTLSDNKKVKGGSDMVYVERGDTSFVYLLKGYKTEFYRYNVGRGSWDTLEPAPAAPGRAKYDKGSFLVYDGENTLYAHQAKFNDGKNHFMYKYDLQTGRWQTSPLKGMPLAGLHKGGLKYNKKSKDGGSGDWYAGHIYALKGAGTQQFFRYVPGADTWYELDTIPQVGRGSTRKKMVKNGADFVSAGGGTFFALKGNKTLELWAYYYQGPAGPQNAGSRPLADGVHAGRLAVGRLQLAVFPNPIASGFATLRFSLPKPGPVSITVYDAVGRSVLRQAGGADHTTSVLDLRTLSAGVYIVRLESGFYSGSRKLVIQ